MISLETKAQASRLILLCGSGGVGKTSLAASVALLGACRGYHTLAFTVDPAKRLSDTLGLRLNRNEIHDVDLKTRYCRIPGRLEAAMLDVESAAQELIDRYAPDETIAKKIRGNRIFQTAIHHLIGSEEYIALGKVFQVLSDHPMQAMVVDTAPTKYALDFFSGSDKLLQLLDPSILNRLLAPVARFSLTGAFSHQSKSLSVINQILQALIGVPFIKEMSDLGVALSSMFDEFRERVKEMHQVLRDPIRTSILIVTTPEWHSLNETRGIIRVLLEEKYPLCGVIMNRITPRDTLPSVLQKSRNAARKLQNDPMSEVLSSSVVPFIEQQMKRRKLETELIRSFREDLPENIRFIEIPFMLHAFHSIDQLQLFHPFLGELEDCIFKSSKPKSAAVRKARKKEGTNVRTKTRKKSPG